MARGTGDVCLPGWVGCRLEMGANNETVPLVEPCHSGSSPHNLSAGVMSGFPGWILDMRTVVSIRQHCQVSWGRTVSE